MFWLIASFLLGAVVSGIVVASVYEFKIYLGAVSQYCWKLYELENRENAIRERYR